MKTYLLISLLTILASCNDIDKIVEEDDEEFEATVIANGDCGIIQLGFRAEDEKALKKITDAAGLRYHALTNTKVLFQPQKKLLVKVRKPTDDEMSACSTFTPTYPRLYLLTFRSIE